MNRIEFIREEEKKYHDYCYDNYKLFEKGSWLYKPVATVMETLSLINDKTGIRVLDLGSGVGRNSIPIAQKIKDEHGRVVCVDLLDSALDKLQQYSYQYGVEEVIETRKADIGQFDIGKEDFDFIVAVSALEHVDSELVFEKVVNQMAAGTKRGGLNCLIVNSEVEETVVSTGEKIDAMMEVNIKTEDMLRKLSETYEGWEFVKKLVKPLEYKILRGERKVLLKTNAITYVVKKGE